MDTVINQRLSAAKPPEVTGRPISHRLKRRRRTRVRRAAAGGNRKGYAGYEFDPTMVGQSAWSVRHRLLISNLGRWARRDEAPIHPTILYEYASSSPLTGRDPSGLANVQVVKCAVGQAAEPPPDNVDRAGPCGHGTCPRRFEYRGPLCQKRGLFVADLHFTGFCEDCEGEFAQWDKTIFELFVGSPTSSLPGYRSGCDTWDNAESPDTRFGNWQIEGAVRFYCEEDIEIAHGSDWEKELFIFSPLSQRVRLFQMCNGQWFDPRVMRHTMDVPPPFWGTLQRGTEAFRRMQVGWHSCCPSCNGRPDSSLVCTP